MSTRIDVYIIYGYLHYKKCWLYDHKAQPLYRWLFFDDQYLSYFKQGYMKTVFSRTDSDFPWVSNLSKAKKACLSPPK